MATIGRPSVIDKDTVQKLEAAFRDGFTVITACHLSGISRSTYYEHIDADEDFSDKMSVARQWVTEQAKKNIVKDINNGDISSSKWWLERKERNEFGKDSQTNAEDETEHHKKRYLDLIKAFMDDDGGYGQAENNDAAEDEMI